VVWEESRDRLLPVANGETERLPLGAVEAMLVIGRDAEDSFIALDISVPPGPGGHPVLHLVGGLEAIRYPDVRAFLEEGYARLNAQASFIGRIT
jgi:hypothetical protein